MGNGIVVGGAQYGADYGIGGVWFGLGACLSYVLFATVMSRLLYRRGYLTIPDLIRDRYQSKQVTVIDRKKEICRNTAFLYREGLLMELDKAHVEICSNTTALSVDADAITAQTDGCSPAVLRADTVIAATGFTPLDNEAEQFRELAYDFWKIGDCFQVRKLFNARREGYNAGAHI